MKPITRTLECRLFLPDRFLKINLDKMVE